MSDLSHAEPGWRDVVARFLESSGEEVYGLTPKKVIERASLIDHCRETGVIVFELERHQSAFGAANRRGSGMHSFVTTLRRYTFNPACEGSIEESSTVTTLGLNLDTRAAAEEYARNFDFEFEHLGGRRYRCSETCNNGSWDVTGKREAILLAEAVADDVCWEHDVECLTMSLETPLTPDQEQEIANDLHNDLVLIVREMLERAWEDFMEERRATRRPSKRTSSSLASRSN